MKAKPAMRPAASTTLSPVTPLRGVIAKPAAAAKKAGGAVVTVGKTPDGFTVYGSDLKPRHRSARRIASAVAKSA